MKKNVSRTTQRIRRHARVRARISGSATRPRVAVFRGLRGMYVQMIDDERGITIAAVHSKTGIDDSVDAGERTGKVKQAYLIGHTLAKKAQEKNITHIVFDRGGFTYHGRVQAVADGLRDAGIIC